jgi:hypothetical protein
MFFTVCLGDCLIKYKLRQLFDFYFPNDLVPADFVQDRVVVSSDLHRTYNNFFRLHTQAQTVLIVQLVSNGMCAVFR